MDATHDQFSPIPYTPNSKQSHMLHLFCMLKNDAETGVKVAPFQPRGSRFCACSCTCVFYFSYGGRGECFEASTDAKGSESSCKNSSLRLPPMQRAACLCVKERSCCSHPISISCHCTPTPPCLQLHSVRSDCAAITKGLQVFLSTPQPLPSRRSYNVSSIILRALLHCSRTCSKPLGLQGDKQN